MILLTGSADPYRFVQSRWSFKSSPRRLTSPRSVLPLSRLVSPLSARLTALNATDAFVLTPRYLHHSAHPLLCCPVVMTVPALPSELISLIVAHDLSRADLHALSLTNRAWSEAATRRLYRTLVFHLLRTADPVRMSSPRKLRRTLLRSPHLAAAARELQIGISSPRPCADHMGEWASIVEDVLEVTTAPNRHARYWSSLGVPASRRCPCRNRKPDHPS
jgi:hypothetical protein